MSDRTFYSLDLYSKEVCEYLGLSKNYSDINSGCAPYSIRGSGNSITGASFGHQTTVLYLEPEKSHMDLNPDQNRLSVSASLTVRQIYNYLVEKGYTLTGLPSYPDVTIGGCIAANVHGQNHYREGSFRKNIIDLKIFHPKYGQIIISPHDSTKVFDLTVGGFGLTGVIIQATLRVIPIHTNLLECHVRRFDTLFDGYQMLVSDANGYDYFHSWANLSDLSKEGEKGFYYAAKYVDYKEIIGNYLEPDWQHRKHLAIKPNLFGTQLLRGLNKIYYFTNARASTKVSVLSDFIFPSRSKLWYFSMFGNRGLIEHQVLIPHQSVEAYLKALRAILRKWNPLISLCHLKLFRGKQSLLNFDGEGLCLAMHLSNNPVSMDTLDEIDNLDIECGVIVNIIKDSRVSKDILCQQYPEYDKFVRRIDDYDKDRIFQNTISQKLFV